MSSEDLKKMQHPEKLDADERQRLRMDDGEWVCPVCGPTTVAPVDAPLVIGNSMVDSPPHCVTCGTAIQPRLPLVDYTADRTAGQIDHIRHQESNYGLRDSITFEKVEKEDSNA